MLPVKGHNFVELGRRCHGDTISERSFASQAGRKRDRSAILPAMCGRYTLRKTEMELAAMLAVIRHVMTPRFNIAPSQQVPVCRVGPGGQLEYCEMRWGLIPHWSKDSKPGYSTINARAETVKSNRPTAHPSGASAVSSRWTGGMNGNKPVHEPSNLISFIALTSSCSFSQVFGIIGKAGMQSSLLTHAVSSSRRPIRRCKRFMTACR